MQTEITFNLKHFFYGVKKENNVSADKARVENNFDLLRLIAAFSVVVSHSFGILDIGMQQPHLVIKGMLFTPSDFGLYIFFTISGYLVTQSVFTSHSYTHYLWKRCIRIVPALAVVNVFCVLAGAFISSLPAKQYFTNSLTWTYVLKNTTLIQNQFLLPGVFTSLHDRSVNASIWTIVLEVRFYIALLMANMLSLLRKKLLLISFIIFGIAAIAFDTKSLQIPFLDLNVYFTFGTYFFLGVVYKCYKDSLFFSKWYILPLLVLALLTVGTSLQKLTFAVFLSYSLITIGSSRALIRTKGWDISYGFYLYAFPIQQLLLLAFGYSVNVWLHISLSVALASAMGTLSWIYIEKPALSKKSLFSQTKRVT